MAAEQEITLIINSDLKDVYLIGILIETLCSLVHLPDDKAFWIKLCVVEAVNNCIIHAYQKETGHEVEVVFTLDSKQLSMKVCDTGIAMPIQEFTQKDVSFKEPENLASVNIGGLGIDIIQETMDIVEYRSQNKRNSLTMIKFVNSPS